MSATPEQIAAGLLPRQRLGILKAYQDDELDDRWWMPSGYGRGLMAMGVTARSIFGAHLTPLGLAVKAILEQQQ